MSKTNRPEMVGPVPLKRLLALALCLSVCALPLRARANESSARAHFTRAEAFYASGDFDAALEEYLAAYGDEPLPELLFNVGQCQRNLERYHEAIFSFRRYLALEPDAPNREAVLNLIGELERLRDRAALRPPPPRPERRAVLAPAPAPARRAHRPFYTRWWFVTGVLAAGLAVTGVVLFADEPGEVPSSDFGNIELPR